MNIINLPKEPRQQSLKSKDAIQFGPYATSLMSCRILISAVSFVGGCLFAAAVSSGNTLIDFAMAGLLFVVLTLIIQVVLSSLLSPKASIIILSGGYLVFIFWYALTPHNYQDCILDGAKNARSQAAVSLVARACYKKFGDR